MSMIQGMGAAIGRWAEGRRARSRLRRDLRVMEENGELDAVLAEAGLTRAQIGPLIAGHPDAGKLLTAMLDRVGIADGAMPVDTMREMGWACTICTDKRRCREWLVAGDDSEYRAFCPNAALLDYALLKQGRSAA